MLPISYASLESIFFNIISAENKLALRDEVRTQSQRWAIIKSNKIINNKTKLNKQKKTCGGKHDQQLDLTGNEQGMQSKKRKGMLYDKLAHGLKIKAVEEQARTTIEET